MTAQPFSREYIGYAYRKAKADIFYTNTCQMAQKVCEYEANLKKNLDRLHSLLQSGHFGWMADQKVVGTWSAIPKSIKLDEPPNSSEVDWRPSDPDRAWKSLVSKLQGNPVAEFRLVGRHSVDFHVLSALWMLTVGHIYDAALGPEAYGSRLRRSEPQRRGDKLGKPNPLSIGSFKHYLSPFSQWRNRGIAAIRSALDAKKSVVAITADIHAFYHNLSPNFLTNSTYLETAGIANSFDATATAFTEGLVSAIHAWTSRTPLHRDCPSVGIPVGLPASALIANVSLVELDKAITRELAPLYYGRYVDDILLVLEDTHGFDSAIEVIDYIGGRLSKIIRIESTEKSREIEFVRAYLGESRIKFKGSKQKVFLLSGDSGDAFVGALERQIRERASEWRALPDVPESPKAFVAKVLSACDRAGEDADNLRKADSVSIRRSTFAMTLRDMEALDLDLLPEVWQAQRTAFFEAVQTNLLSLPRLFEFAQYVPRLFALAISSRDYTAARALVARLEQLSENIHSTCIKRLAGSSDNSDTAFSKWKRHLFCSLYESMAGAVRPVHATDDVIELSELLEALRRFTDEKSHVDCSVETLINWAECIFAADFGKSPARATYLPHYCADSRGKIGELFSLRSSSPKAFGTYAHHRVTGGVRSFLKSHRPAKKKPLSLPLALLFPTRPFSLAELCLFAPPLRSSKQESHGEPEGEDLSSWTLAFRGFRARTPPPRRVDHEVIVPWRSSDKPLRIAVTSWHTVHESWVAALTQQPDPDQGRYFRLNKLLNGMRHCAQNLDYVVFPELSIPSRWYMRFALKLSRYGTSLISGVEYLHHGNDAVSNQVWASLMTDYLGFSTPFLLRQDKLTPALNEERSLYDVAGKRLVPLRPDPMKPCIRHGGFHFGILICSELTNIEYRADFRGKVDAVFVPEWNPDTETFASLVESAALDIHAYIIQCNDRQFGDSRIRAPRKRLFERDVVRIKGGTEDYFVIGDIDVAALRKFQSNYRSPSNGEFKPVPDGYKIAEGRICLPDSETRGVDTK